MNEIALHRAIDEYFLFRGFRAHPTIKIILSLNFVPNWLFLCPICIFVCYSTCILLRLTVCNAETKACLCYGIVCVEEDSSCVTATEQSPRAVCATICTDQGTGGIGPIPDLNSVIPTGGMELQRKRREFELHTLKYQRVSVSEKRF